MSECHHLLPGFLCRKCHPELNPSVDELPRALVRERREREAVEAVRAAQRELDGAKRKLASLMRGGEPEPESVAGKIAASLRKKVIRLEQQRGCFE
jgi:hypothetical protein